MPYNIRLPDGTIVQNIPDEVTPQEAKKRILQKFPELAPQTTLLGQAAEFGKGLVPGAVGLVESALTGASALLPEQAEQAVRQKISTVAEAVREPFKAAPGYEESVGRKLGESVGSTAPFLVAGPLGLAGRIGATALGVGAGAGEARTRAEKEAATAEQRAAATALGVIPGALEAFAPLRILGRMGDDVVRMSAQQVKRALIAGGEEAAQEVASNIAQNLIAKGVYKPEQEIIEGIGEAAAYGGATGAIVQGLMDLALGRRARKPGEKSKALEEVEREAAAESTEKVAEGAPDVGPTVTSAGGTGFEILEQPSEPGVAAGVEGTQPSGVVPAGADAGAPVTGETTEPVAVEQAVTEAAGPQDQAGVQRSVSGEEIPAEPAAPIEEAPAPVAPPVAPPVAAPAPAPVAPPVAAPAPAAPVAEFKTTEQVQERATNYRQELLDKRTAQAQALGIDLRDIPKTEVDQQIEAIEQKIGSLYDSPDAAASRRDAVYDDDTISLIEELEKGKLPPGLNWSGPQFERLSELLVRNDIDPIEYQQVAPEEAPAKINQLLTELGKKRTTLREWKKLTQDQRDVYLGALRPTPIADGRYEITPRSRAAALRALAQYTQQMERTESGEIKATPAAALYEREKSVYEKKFGIKLPTKWALIPEDLRNKFSEVVKAGTRRPKGAKAQVTQESTDKAFDDLVDSLLEAGMARPLMLTESDVAKAALQRREKKSLERAQQEIEEERKKKQKPKAEQPSVKPTAKDTLPDHIVEQIKKGNTAPVLDYLRNKASGGQRIAPQTVYRAVGKKVFDLKLKTKIEYVPEIQGGRIAEYDPRTDTIRLTDKGLTESTVLHELVHAATVKILNKYLNGDYKGLTDEQIAAADQIVEVMELARKDLSRNYPEAFKSPYEFVSYALTDIAFQRDLSALDASSLEFTVLPSTDSSLWSELVASFAKLFDAVIKVAQLKGPKVKGQPVITESNALLETVAAFEQILAVPEGGIEMTPLAQQKTLQAEDREAESDDEIAQRVLKRVELKEHGAKRFVKALLSKRGYDWIVTKFQNDRRAIMNATDRAERFGILKRTTDDLNDVGGQITRSTGIAETAFQTHLREPTKEVHDAVNAYATKKDISINEALERLHLVFESRHEPERRRVKFLLTVPLDDQAQVFKFPGDKQTYSAAGMREEILRRLSEPDPNMTPEQHQQAAKDYRVTLNNLVDLAIKNTKYRAPQIKEQVGKKTVTTPVTDEFFSPDNERYNVVGGYSPREISVMKRFFDTKEDANEINAIEAALRKVEEKTRELNKQANYWSQPVENLVDFYGFEHYVPFKGKPGVTQHDEDLNLDPRRLGGELQDAQNSFEGRLSEAENPILQMLADGAVASMRFGRKDLTLAIKNAIKDKIVKGEFVTNIKFSDRYLGREDIKELGGPDKIFHYNPDGTIDILKINDPAQREAIRRSYREARPLIDAANSFTSGLGQTHTRFNPAFGPMNFVRDALTNAFTLGAELGPSRAGKLLTAVSEEVATFGFARSVQFSHYYADGNTAELNRLAGGKKPYDQLTKNEQYFRDLLDYVEMGGKVSYLQGIAAKGQLDQLVKEVEKNGITKTTKESISKVFDLYNEMFELSSRVATYRMLKKDFEAENRAKGIANPEAEAKAKAVEYTKNLANFEQVGEWGKTAGAFFMFFRPAATGAIRAIDAMKPAFGFNEAEFRKGAEAEGRTPEQIDKAVKSMKEQTRNARTMSLSLLGFGAMVYALAYMAAGEDEEDRNKVGIDDMARWTRYARLQIPGTDTIIQIPWGFGLGAFAAAGAQLASVVSRNSLADALVNISTIGMDSFLPVPVSRISPLDNPLAWVVDSVFPSALRPFVEYVMNLDGLGREIYNNRQSKYGDAYTGGDNIPEAYKDAARSMFNATEGAVDISPNTLYFFASNYVDGPAKILNTGYNWLLNATGERNFDFKNDMIFLSSFVGTKSNIDAREFSAAEKKIKEFDKRIKSLKEGDPIIYERFLDKNPDAEMLVDFYNKEVNRDLRDVRKWANEVRADRGLTAAERKTELEMIIEISNRIKRRMLEEMKDMGYTP